MCNKGSLKTLTRGLLILEHLAHHPEGLTNAQIAAHFQMDPSTSFRFLQTLTKCGFAHKEGLKYCASFRLLGLLTLVQDTFSHLAKPFVAWLAEKTGFTASLATLEGYEVIPIILMKGKFPLVVNHNLGKPVPLHATALGKATLAFLPKTAQEWICKSLPLKSFTENTITVPQDLVHELRRIRERGYAIDREEFLSGVRCVAAPVLNDNRQVVASISVSYPASHGPRNDESMAPLIRHVTQVAGELSSLIGFKQLPESQSSYEGGE